MSSTRWLGLFACGVVGACASDDVADPAAPTARELVAEGQTFLVDPDTSSASFHYQVTFDDETVAYSVDAPVQGGVFVAMLDENGDLQLDQLTLLHDSFPLDIQVDYRGFLPWVSALEVRAEGDLRFPDTTWSEDGEIAMTADAGGLVSMRWGVRSGGTETRGFEGTTMMESAAMVLSDPDEIEILLGAHTNKVAWTWARYTFSSYLEVSLDATIERE